MPSYIYALIFVLIAWRLYAFVKAYKRARSESVERQAEREQKKDWAQRMQGRSEQDR